MDIRVSFQQHGVENGRAGGFQASNSRAAMEKVNPLQLSCFEIAISVAAI